MKTPPQPQPSLVSIPLMLWVWLFMLGMLLLLGTKAHGEPAVQAWVRYYAHDGGSSDDQPTKAATDANENVIVAGTTDGQLLIIKVSGAGVPLWTNRYIGPGNNQPAALAVDGEGNVIVPTLDYTTIKFSSGGIPLWTNRYQGPSTVKANAVGVDGTGNVFVTGYASGSGSEFDYTTIGYSGAGVPLWTNRYNGPGNTNDEAKAIAVDAFGNVTITGVSGGIGTSFDYATIKYSSAGLPLWTNRYNGPTDGEEQAAAVAVDLGGNVFVTGHSTGSGTGFDYATLAYSADGVPLWTNRYDGPAGGTDRAEAVVVDNNGDVIVTGASYGYPPDDGRTVTNSSYATIKYSGDGVPLWTNRDHGVGSAHTIALDDTNNVIVGGRSRYAIIKYSAAGVALWTNNYSGAANSGPGSLAVDRTGNVFAAGWAGFISHGVRYIWTTTALSASGAPLWTYIYDGPAPGDDNGYAVAVDADGNVLVTGSSANREGGKDSATVKYSDAGVPLWTNRAGLANAVVVDGGGNVLVTGPSFTTLKYSSLGMLVWTNRYQDNGSVNGRDIAVDSSGNVIVTGFSQMAFSYSDYVTIKYSTAGVPLWTNYDYGVSNGGVSDVAVDANGNVFVTGYGYNDYLTIAYSGAGVPMWTKRYNGSAGATDQAGAVATDASGNVFVTGTATESLSGEDFVTIKYSGTGMPIWTNRYNGPGNSTDKAAAMVVDSAGNVIVTGWSGQYDANGFDYATVKYSNAGVLLWSNLYNQGDDRASAVAVDSSGNVFVTGNSSGSATTIKYSSAGETLWTHRMSGSSASRLATGPNGAVYVAGSKRGALPRQDYDYFTVKLVPLGLIAVQPFTVGSSGVHLNLSGDPASSWTIERAPAATGPWTTLGPVLIGPSGSGQFEDTNPPHPAGFYRARQP